MAPHSSILVWRIPWTEEPGGLQSVGLQSQTPDTTESLPRTITGCLFGKRKELLSCTGPKVRENLRPLNNQSHRPRRE